LGRKIVIISGSPSKESRFVGVLRAAAEALERKGAQVGWVHVCDLPADDLLAARFHSASIREAVVLVEEADAVILGSQVYKASFTGVLKTFLDALPQNALSGKPVLPLMMGGTIAHLLVIDYALKPVLSALGATRQLSGVYAVEHLVARLENGDFKLADELAVRLQAAIDQLWSAVGSGCSYLV